MTIDDDGIGRTCIASRCKSQEAVMLYCDSPDGAIIDVSKVFDKHQAA